MSDTFVAVSRSNYFRVKDEDKFREGMDALELVVVSGSGWAGLDPPEHKFMIYPQMGDWPDLEDDPANEAGIQFHEILMDHLPPGEICILHTIGYEKLRYLNHAMVAFTSAGVVLHDSQESFYDELNRLGYKFTRAEN